MMAAQAPAGAPGPELGAAMHSFMFSFPQKQSVKVLLPSAQLLVWMHCATASQVARSSPLKIEHSRISEQRLPSRHFVHASGDAAIAAGLSAALVAAAGVGSGAFFEQLASSRQAVSSPCRAIVPSVLNVVIGFLLALPVARE
jgi:hypothetical protein